MRFAVVLVLIATGACARGDQFRPYKAEYAQGLVPVTARAVVAYEGDIDTLSTAGATLLGWVQTKSDRVAQIRAVGRGGTHVVLVKASTHVFNVGTNCQTYVVGNTASTSCRQVNVSVPERNYAVLRLDADRWSVLPVALRPSAMTDATTRDPGCEALPAVPPGCAYTHGDGFHGFDNQRWWLACAGKSSVEVTDQIPENVCWE